MRFALRQLICFIYGYGHFRTSEAHFSRFDRFLRYVKAFGVRDFRDITREHVIDYAKELRRAIDDGELSVSYANNLLSSVNHLLTHLRNDHKLRVNAYEYLPRRSYVLNEMPDVTREKIQAGIDDLDKHDNPLMAASFTLINAFGLRLKESILCDLDRLKSEAMTGFVTILEGTKGGRKCDSRKIEVTPERMAAIDYAIERRPAGSKNLLARGRTYIQFLRSEVKKGRAILKGNGINKYKDLRSYFFMEMFEMVTGLKAPIKDPNTLKDPGCLEGFKIVALAAGHYRASVTRSYVG